MVDENTGLIFEQNLTAVALRAKVDEVWRQWTYSQVIDLARRVAGGLLKAGVQPGDRVALYGENSPEWIFAYLGIYMAGAVVVPLDAQFSLRELKTILEFADCRLVLCPHSKSEIIAQVHPVQLAIDAGSEIFSSVPMETPAPRQSDDLMTIIFTSGTTGEPKGVCLSAGNITANLRAIRELGLIGPTDTVLALLPFHHAYALTASVLTGLGVGGSITLCDSLRGPDIIAAMRETGVSVVIGVPKLYEGFDRAIGEKVKQMPRMRQKAVGLLTAVSHAIRTRTSYNPGRVFFRSVHRTFGPRFRFFVSGGAKLDPVVTDRFLDMGIRVVEGYGLTETSPVVSFNPVEAIRPGSVGNPLPGVQVKIDNPNPEGVGEILIHGANVMVGYDRRPEETAGVLRGGWFHSGDLGYIDRDGYLFITGRAKEVIVLGSGKNIYPEDVERHYEQSRIIKEVCIMPVELSDGRVERLRALVVPDLEELQRRRVASVTDEIHHEITHLSRLIPSYMRVTDLKIVSGEFPRTRLGKLKRSAIAHTEMVEVAGNTVALDERDHTLLAMPGADRLLARLRLFSKFDGEILPRHNLELDLGLDSLARIELAVALEQEFHLAIPADQSAQIVTVGDLLSRMNPGEAAESGPVGWGEILHQPVSPPLESLFDLKRGRLTGGSLNIVRGLARSLARPLFPLEIRGLEHLPVEKPYLLCPNHCSMIDSVLVFISLPNVQSDRMFYLGAADYFQSFIMRRLARLGHVIPTATSDTVLESLRRAAQVLRKGGSICIFPEGFISRDGYLQRPRPGAGILACELNVPIVPVLVRGSYEILSHAHPGFRFRPVGLTFAPPLEPPKRAEYTNGDYAAMVERWREAIVRLCRQNDATTIKTAEKSPFIPENNDD